MPKMPDTVEQVRSKAIEIGVYLPLGAYSRVRDEISGLSRRDVDKLFADLIDRGQDRIKPIERNIRRRAAQAEDDAKDRATTARAEARTGSRRAKTTAKKTTRKATTRAEAAAGATVPTMPRVAAPRSAQELPITGYDSLTANEIVTRLTGLTQTDLARVYKYEKAHEKRSTILETIESRFVELPIPTYDALTAEEIENKLPGLTEGELEAVRRYEDNTKARSTVIEKIDSLLSA